MLHVLAEQSPKPGFGGLFIVAAPFVGESGWPSDDIDGREDFSGSLPPGLPVHLYHGADAAVVPAGHVHLYAKAIPHAVVHMLEGKDHQLNNDMSDVARDISSLC